MNILFRTQNATDYFLFYLLNANLDKPKLLHYLVIISSEKQETERIRNLFISRYIAAFLFSKNALIFLKTF